MNYLLTILLLIPVANRLTGIDAYLYEMINGLAGRSWIFDNLIVLPVENNLVKAAVIGACFLMVWVGGKDEAETARRRKILLITLLASVFVIGTTKTLSKTVFLPRPFIQSQKTFHLEGDQLVESPRLEWHVPLDKESQKNFKELQNGEIIQNDLGTFPSDHSGFYMTLAVGILLACRSIGLIALGWTIFVTLGSRVITGQHTPLDIAVGSGIGIGILLILQFIIGNWGKRLIDPIVNWTLKHSALSSAIIFIFIFEATNTLENIRPLLKLGVDIVKHLIRG
ncbi:MAG: phosphatase PAP2 family protein [Pyrinomonadaceae bacterium]|nr:phosphatase PAP2 family protein [Pyrinomonadaceae bacterium]